MLLFCSVIAVCRYFHTLIIYILMKMNVQNPHMVMDYITAQGQKSWSKILSHVPLLFPWCVDGLPLSSSPHRRF